MPNVKLPLAKVGNKYSQKPEVELRIIFDILLGGVPRKLFGAASMNDKLNEIESIVAKTPFTVWQNVLRLAIMRSFPKRFQRSLYISSKMYIPQ